MHSTNTVLLCVRTTVVTLRFVLVVLNSSIFCTIKFVIVYLDLFVLNAFILRHDNVSISYIICRHQYSLIIFIVEWVMMQEKREVDSDVVVVEEEGTLFH